MFMSDEMNNINVSIEEKRAPTDESVKILREMEEKVLNKILGSITLRFCEADLSFVYMFDVFTLATEQERLNIIRGYFK